MRSGKEIRMSRIIDHESGKTFIVPIDDGLLDGPFGGLYDMDKLIREIIDGKPNAILGFRYIYNYVDLLKGSGIGIIENLTASSSLGDYNDKRIISTVKDAIIRGADGVAVHVNIGSKHEPNMLENLGKIVSEAGSFDFPVLALMYARGEKINEANIEEYTNAVAHAVRIGAEYGVDLIKAQFTGSIESFSSVIKGSKKVPIIIAGGPIVSDLEILNKVYLSLKAGGVGAAIGRNTFNNENPKKFIHAVKKVIFDNLTPEKAVLGSNDV